MNESIRANSRFISASGRKKLRCVTWQVLPPMRTWLPKNNSPRWKNLEQQDKRNKEIAVEKTVADAKKQILDVDTSESKFTQDEEKMIYFFLLSSLRREHFGVFGIGEKKRLPTP